MIEEAIKYIDSLHVALFQRLQQQAAAAATNTSKCERNNNFFLISDACLKKLFKEKEREQV